MGRVYTFTCPRCEYQARVSGATETGFHCVTQTVSCRDCRALHDVTVRLRVAETTEAAPPKSAKKLPAPDAFRPPLLLFGQPRRTRWLELKPLCPVSPSHRIEVWTAPGKCPRCGMFLDRDVMPYRIWD